MDICISTWSLRDHVGQEFPLSRFGHIVKERYDISAVEICQMHLVTYRFGFAFPAQESYFLDAIRTAMLKETSKSSMSQLMLATFPKLTLRPENLI